MVHGQSRRQAWTATLEEAGLSEGGCVEADFSAEAGAAATEELLDLAEPPTAIVYANDLMAMAGLAVAVARGIAVPGELSVIGFEDTELAAHLQPPLTTVQHRRRRPGGGPPPRRLLELIDPDRPDRRARPAGPPRSSCAPRPAPPRPDPHPTVAPPNGEADENARSSPPH